MGEHLPCKQRVASSSLVDSTTRFGTHVGKCIQTHIRRIPVVCIPSRLSDEETVRSCLYKVRILIQIILNAGIV